MARQKNLSLIMNLAWRFKTSSKNMLWAQILYHKYNHRKHLNTCSFIWRSLCQGWELCWAGLTYLIGDGSNVSFWNDRWCGDLPIRAQISGPLPESADIEVVNTYIHNGCWSLDSLPFELPYPSTKKFHCIYLPNSIPLDSFYWNPTPHGSFTSKYAYDLLQDNTPIAPITN